MASCWKALQSAFNTNLFVVAFQASDSAAFADSTMEGIPCAILGRTERADAAMIESLVMQRQPHVVVVSGWFHKPYRRLLQSDAVRDAVRVMAMDTPWRGGWRQTCARWILRSYLQRMDCVVVPGERAWQYARRLGVQSAKIAQGLYGIDGDMCSQASRCRLLEPWPKSFLFVGRYSAAKAVDVLARAYRRYRTKVVDPWPLVCCGCGPLMRELEGQPGVVNQGFRQPREMGQIWQNAGAFVLPSRFDPWPLAIVEAAVAGLPIVCSDACGSAVEIVRSGYNGLTIPADDEDSLANALVKIQALYGQLPEWGARSAQLAAPYHASQWAIRWAELLGGLCAGLGRR